MNYVEILSMILNSDNKTTKEYCSALKDINSKFFIDTSMISDTPAYKNAGKGFITIYEHEGEIVLEYMFNGTGSIKSCTKKVKFEFNKNIDEELVDLCPDKLTDDVADDVFDYSQFCASCIVYDVKRDSVDFNNLVETPKYLVDYYLRKTQDNKYFLQADLLFKKPITKNNISMYKLNVVFSIDDKYQKLIPLYNNTNNSSDLFDADEYDEFDNEYEYDEFDKNPFDDISKLGPGTYDLETGTFTPDDENSDIDEDLYGY